MFAKPLAPAASGSTVAIFGAGIAGLTAAHELCRLGYNINVYERGSETGGFFRSTREGKTQMPTEYSWHGMGPWYYNAFDLLRQIPFDEKGSVYDRCLSRPIDFGIFRNGGTAEFYDNGLRSIPRMFHFSVWEFCRWSWLMLKVWTAERRSEETYARLNAAAQWKPLLRRTGYLSWRACFGPWIGSDWTRVSLHTAGHFFRKQLTSPAAHVHPPDETGPAWRHVTGDGWLLLKGPSSEVWFDRWVRYLRTKGVVFAFGSPLQNLQGRPSGVVSAILESGEVVAADHFILATNPFAAAGILARSATLETAEPLGSLAGLVREGPHTQVSFQIGFAAPIKFPRIRTAVVLADSPFNITLFAEEQVWRAGTFLGEGVQSLWTGTACVSAVPGIVYGLPLERCTKDQFVDEIRAQIRSVDSLDAMIREANGGRGLDAFPIVVVEVWHEWEFSPSGIKGDDPKWVNSTETQPHQPSQRTPISNLFLAGAHTRTTADVWSIEAAVESGRRAAKEIDSRVAVISQPCPRYLEIIRRFDNVLFRFGGPHIMDVSLVFGVVTLLGLVTLWLY